MTAARDPGRLPVATRQQVRQAIWHLARHDARALTAVFALYFLSALAGLAGPWLVGEIIDRTRAGAGIATVNRLGLAIVGLVATQLVLERTARYAGRRFGERVLARLREGFVDRALRLPLSTVEHAGSGDLMTRGTGDVTAVAPLVRDAGPEILLATVQAALVVGAVFLLSPLLGLCALIGLPLLWLALRWYLPRARTVYLAEGAANSELSEELAATVEGARTVEALGLTGRRISVGDETVVRSVDTRRRTLYLRSIFFPTLEISRCLPVAGMLTIGGALHSAGYVSLGAAVAAVLYVQRLNQMLNAIMMWLERCQEGSAAFARIAGVGLFRPAGATGNTIPTDDRLEVAGVRYAYRDGHDVLHGIDLSVRPGERLAVVGPSGAGKSTLARLLTGIDPPRAGRITIGGVPISDLPPAELRRRVVLVAQEYHIFLGTVRDNLLLARANATDDAIHAALATVGADWARTLPAGLDTYLGTGGLVPHPGQAQQLALARLVLADPHTVILDEATSLLDPSSARRTERALAAALAGRTVVAIAHRLHTGHDADRVAVIEQGRITELGSHQELVAAGGSYAELWRAWHGAGERPAS